MKVTTPKAALCLLFIVKLAFAGSFSDIIQPIKLTAGKTDTLLISDIFYAKSYDIKFEAHSFIKVTFHQKSGTLILTPRADFNEASLLCFKMANKNFAIPVLPNTSSGTLVRHVFQYFIKDTPKEVSVVGSFNGWNKDKNPMKRTQAGDAYMCEILLKPGSHVYKFSIDGKEILDPLNPERAPTGFETFNSVVRIPEPQNLRNYIHIGNFAETAKNSSFSFYFERENQAAPLRTGEIMALLDNEVIDKAGIRVDKNEIVISLPKEELDGERMLRLFAVHGGITTNIQTIFIKNAKPLSEGEGRFNWFDASVYSIMIDRFNDGDKANSVAVRHDSLFPQANYLGGDFQGIIDKIEDGYFSKLGVNVLWLSPVYDNPNVAFREYPKPYRWYSGYHGYWPVSQNAVEEKFGTMPKLKELVSIAHKNKIKVLLDIVAHHVHIDNPLFEEKPDWFGTLDLPDGRKNLRLWDEFRLTTWFEPYMPSFDYTRSIDPVNYMAENSIWWLKETGADGFRHDAVKHVPNLFWRSLTRALKEKVEIPEKKKVYQIGETFGDYELIGSYVNNGQLCGQFNFNLSYLAIPVFLEKQQSFSTLDFHMKKTFTAYGINHLMGNIMDSHDKIRFMAYADGDVGEQGVDTRELAWSNPPKVDNPDSYKKAELYYAYMFTIPGIPFIYYGSEFGMTGADDPDNRRMMRFGSELTSDESQMLTATSGIVKIRNRHSALRYGDFQTLLADEMHYAYSRTDLNERLIIVLCKSETGGEARLTLPDVYGGKTLTDVVTGEKIESQDKVFSAKMPPYGWRIFTQNK